MIRLIPLLIFLISAPIFAEATVLYCTAEKYAKIGERVLVVERALRFKVKITSNGVVLKGGHYFDDDTMIPFTDYSSDDYWTASDNFRNVQYVDQNRLNYAASVGRLGITAVSATCEEF
jgi:hypothetical protein